MTPSTSTDPAVTVRGRGALPGRRAHSRISVGGGDRSGAGHLVEGRPVPTRHVVRRPRSRWVTGAFEAFDASGAGRGR